MNARAAIDAGLKGAAPRVGELLWQLNVPEARHGQGALLTVWPVSWQVTPAQPREPRLRPECLCCGVVCQIPGRRIARP